MGKREDALALLIALGAAQDVMNCDYTRTRRGNNRGGKIPCMICGNPTDQVDDTGLGDSMGLCPKCKNERYGRRR
jgi:hypothetical protein